MAGNAAEWCLDWFRDDAYMLHGANAGNPLGPSNGTQKVFRGGSWSDDHRSCQVFKRFFADPQYRDSFLGFRVVVPAGRAEQ